MTRFHARPRLRMCGAAAVLLAGMFVGKGQSMADTRDRGDGAGPFEAEIILSDGPGAPSAQFKLRGTVLSILLQRGEDGGMAGLYQMNLDQHDTLLAALSSLPTTVAGPPPSPGMPVASFAVRAHGKEQKLTVLRPATDARVDQILRELGRYERTARDKPRVALSLAVQHVSSEKGGRPQTVTLRVSAKGELGAEVTLDPGLILLQAAPEPKPAPAGITPLPPEWDQVSAPLAGASLQPLKAGTTIDVKLVVNVSAAEPRRLRAFYDGNASFRAPDFLEDVRLRLASHDAPLGATRH